MCWGRPGVGFCPPGSRILVRRQWKRGGQRKEEKGGGISVRIQRPSPTVAAAGGIPKETCGPGGGPAPGAPRPLARARGWEETQKEAAEKAGGAGRPRGSSVVSRHGWLRTRRGCPRVGGAPGIRVSSWVGAQLRVPWPEGCRARVWVKARRRAVNQHQFWGVGPLVLQ